MADVLPITCQRRPRLCSQLSDSLGLLPADVRLEGVSPRLTPDGRVAFPLLRVAVDETPCALKRRALNQGFAPHELQESLAWMVKGCLKRG